MKEQFETFNFRDPTLKTINQANEIIDLYLAQGYTLTVRQLYYQFVARDLIPNNMRSYQRLVNIVSNGRKAGMIDWEAIEDRTRNLAGVAHWGSPTSIMRSAAESFRMDKWAKQPARCEVWIEKEALAGVISRICRSLDVDYFSCRGYVSQSEMKDAGDRLAGYNRDGQDVYVFHLGDHDPSGLDMTRDIEDRLYMFSRGRDIVIDRLALNLDQIELYNPPPNFAKQTDARFKDYYAKYGDDSWELDALEPQVLSDLVETAVLEVRDQNLWEEAWDEEHEHRKQLSEAANRWGQVTEFLNGSHFGF